MKLKIANLGTDDRCPRKWEYRYKTGANVKTILEEARDVSRKAIYDGRDQVKAIVEVVEQAHADRRQVFREVLQLAVEYARTTEAGGLDYLCKTVLVLTGKTEVQLKPYEYIWEHSEVGWDADFSMGSIGTTVEEDGTVGWCVQIEDLLEDSAATEEQARADAHKALIDRLEIVLAELKGGAP